MKYDQSRIRTLVHYEQISKINPNFKLTAEQQAYLDGYRTEMVAQNTVKEEDLESTPFQLVEETADGIEEVDESAVLAAPRKRSRRKKEETNESE